MASFKLAKVNSKV